MPSTQVRNESIQVEVESKKRTADKAIEDIDPRMEGNEETADDDVTLACGRVQTEHGDDPMGEGTMECGRERESGRHFLFLN